MVINYYSKKSNIPVSDVSKYSIMINTNLLSDNKNNKNNKNNNNNNNYNNNNK